jgi:hypothetical protein
MPGHAAFVELSGMIGTIARGLVFALVGVLVIDAAVIHKAAQSGGIDKALLTLRNQPFGEFLMMLAALGLAVFGVYGLCEARWRKVLARRDYGPAREGNLAWLMLPPRCQGM